jgi:hypothetical protein
MLSRGGVVPVLRLRPDGTFTDEGLWSVLTGDPSVGATGGVGAYEVRDYTLVLRYDDGRVRLAALSMFLRASAQASPAVLFVQRTELHRMP